MDTILALKLAVDIAQFVEVTTEGLFMVRKLHKSDKTENEVEADFIRLINTLLEQTAAVQFQLPDGVTLLSEDDEVSYRLSQQCEQVSKSTLLEFDRLKRASLQVDSRHIIQEQGGSDGILQQLEAIRGDLEDSLAPRQRSSLNQILRELTAKNSRLDANRSIEIKDLTSEINTSFEQIKSRELENSKQLDLWSKILLAAEKLMDFSAEQVILSALHFWTMSRREDSISKEHENTFGWILEGASTEKESLPVVNFLDWLVEEEPVYWISGKPGSGKSTLMKFIAENQKTLDGLQQWAGDDKLITASFYFWSSAKDPLQKSGTGLLRSILFQILRQCPDLIQHAFPEQWQNWESQSSLRRFAQTDPTTAELLAAYHSITGLLSTTKVKFCFFIDGLDEYDGEPSDIIRLIDALSRTSNLKACISSRQWIEFENIFGGANPWKLYVHQFTRSDMKGYVEDLLHNDERFTELETSNSEGDVQSLVTDVVEKAEGVFLWVFLVVRALLEGLCDADNILGLQHRLAAIPNDLDQYFDKMLLDIDPSARAQTAHIFEITLEAADKLPLMCYWFAQDEDIKSTTKAEQQSISKETAAKQLTETTRRLNTASRGLLKASGIGPDGGIDSGIEEKQWLFDFRVDFLHRTVGDYLRTAHMRKLLKEWSAESFNADFEICKACLATIKCTPPTSDMFKDAPHALSILHTFFSHATHLAEDVQRSLVDELISSLKTKSGKLEEIAMMILGPGNYWAYESSFDFAIVYHCISYGLGEYATAKLDGNQLKFSEPSSGLLSGCLSWDPRVRTGKLTLDVETMQLLLRRGFNPNVPWGDRGFSFWQQLLTRIYSSHLKGMVTQDDCEAVQSVIDHGADLNAQVEIYSRGRVNETRAVDILDKVLSKEQLFALRVAEPVLAVVNGVH
jgi:hypothetical protein